MIDGQRSGICGRSIVHWLRAALTAGVLLFLAGSWSARADYVAGLNPQGDNYLSLRSGPGAGYEELLRMGPDTIVTVIERRGDWRRVELEDGTVGWAFGRYIKRGFPPGYEPAEPEPAQAFGKQWDSWRGGSAGAAVDYPTDLFTSGAEPSGGASVTFTSDAVDATMEVRTVANASSLDAAGLRGFLLRPGEKASYSEALPEGFVVSGRKGGQVFYRKALLSADGSAITVLDLTYPAELQESFDRIVGRVGASLAAAERPSGTATARGETEPGTGQATGAGGTTDADLERLRLQAEIERLRLEKLKLEQQPGTTTAGPATGPQGGTATLPEGRRVALVIGNSDYSALTPLTTPANDATALGERLARLGYEVLLGVNKDRQGMAQLLAEFYTKAQGAGVALFYFSGHGMQIEGRNYLLPTDAAFANESAFLDVDARAFDLQKFIAVSSTAQISVVFVDACRDNPILEKSIVSTLLKGAGSSMTKGLAVVKRESLNKGQFVGFAAEPGKTAETGTGEISVYTQALLKELEQPGLDISIMHRRIRGDVEAATNGRQSPRYVDDLADAFTLNPAQ